MCHVSPERSKLAASVYGYQHRSHKLTIPRTLPDAWTVQFFSRPGRSFLKAHNEKLRGRETMSENPCKRIKITARYAFLKSPGFSRSLSSDRFGSYSSSQLPYCCGMGPIDSTTRGYRSPNSGSRGFLRLFRISKYQSSPKSKW